MASLGVSGIRLFSIIILIVFLSAGANAHHDQGGSALSIAGDEPVAGQSFWVGYHALTPNGATYTFWPEGHEAPVIDWDLPEGFTLGMTRWPQFEKFENSTGNYFGFSPGTVIYQEIKVPENWDGGAFHVGLKLAYFVCSPDCGQIYEAAKLDFGGAEAPENMGPLPADPYDLQRLALHANAGTNGDLMVAAIFRYEDLTAKIKAAWFLSTTPGVMASGPALRLKQSEKKFYDKAFRGYLGVTPHAKSATEIPMINGIILFEMADGSYIRAYPFERKNDYIAIAALGFDDTAPAPEFTLLTAFLFALVGGIILNIMPCVLPVLALKVFAFMKAGATSPKKLRADGIAYTLGILLSFAAVGGILMALRAGGDQIGWGFQMQSPVFVFAMALLIFAIGLNFLGAFELSAGKLAGLGQKLTEKQGPSGAFFTGVLATVVATPCTAPFMAGALAFGLSASPAVGFLVFLGLGLGLALPYLILSFIPALGKFLPKPGAWMNTFKQFLAFPLFATVIWLLWILNIQSGPNGLLVALSALLVLALAVWLGRVLSGKMLGKAFVVVLLASAISPLVFAEKALPTVERSMATSWERIELIEYNAEDLARLRAEGTPVLIHFWAAWCPICILHEEFVFKTDEFGDFVADEGIVFMFVDNTTTSEEIWTLIQSYGREGQPIDVFYPPGEEVVVLPELFNKSYLLDRLAKELEQS